MKRKRFKEIKKLLNIFILISIISHTTSNS